MALRKFKTEDGRQWDVWDTYPAIVPDATALGRYMANQAEKDGVQPVGVRPQFASGWLTFTSDGERKRLAPVPTDWQAVNEPRLRLYLANAKLVPSTKK